MTPRGFGSPATQDPPIILAEAAELIEVANNCQSAVDQRTVTFQLSQSKQQLE